MKNLLPFLIVGVTSGSVYGLAGIGLVLTYKTSGIFNFAYGAMATVAAYTFYELWVTLGIPWAAALAIVLIGVSAVLGLVLERLAKRLAQVSLALQVVATVGLVLVVESTYYLVYGPTARLFPSFLPTETFRLAGVNVGYDKVIIVAISSLLTAALYLLFRTTQIGRQMRAVVDDSELLDLTGVSADLVRRWAWIAGCFLVALSGILLAPAVDLDPQVLTLLIVQAFGAAAIGGFSSLPMTWVGGLFIGLAASVTTKYVSSSSSSILAGIPPSIPFIVLFVVILFRHRERAYQAVKMAVDSPSADRWRVPMRVQGAGGMAVMAFLLLVPLWDTLHLLAWTLGLTTVVLLLSLGLLVRLSGQVSLCQVSFAAIGTVAFSHIDRAGVPWLISLVLAGLIAVPVGALLAVPAIRLSGLYLALATFGFGLLLRDMFYQSHLMFGPNNSGIAVPRPDIATGDRQFYYLVLAVTVVMAAVVAVVSISRLGRLLRGMAESESAIAVCGTDITRVKIAVFCLSAFVAAIAGALSGMSLGTVTGANYDPISSLTYIALIVIAVGGVPWYAVLTGIGLAIVPAYITSPSTGYYLELLFGLSAVAVACGFSTPMPQPVRNLLTRLGGPVAPQGAPSLDRSQAEVGMAADAQEHILEVHDLAVYFGGLRAVDGLTFTNRTGVITGVIGPNGAGKTTTFNACSGLVPVAEGRISLDGVDIGSLTMPARAKLGLGRTFQTVDLLDTYSAADNVRLAAESALTAGTSTRLVVGRRGDRHEIRQRTADALAACDLTAVSDRPANVLTNHERRLLSLARCLAAGFRIIMLDEPSAGLDSRETAAFGRLLLSLARVRNLGIVLVEHDMSLVMSVCDEIYVLDFGKEVMHGSPAEVQRDPAVRAAYLGQDPVVAAGHDRVG